MEENPLGELCQGVVDISKFNIQNCEFLHRLTSLLHILVSLGFRKAPNLLYTYRYRSPKIRTEKI